MTKYICKCGRVVAKSTSADNTGNRDTAGCEGCPYLLPWGPMVWDDQQKGYTQDVKGYECRMSPTLEYVSTYHGRADDKCSLHIVSLDLDFLDEVQAWIYDNAAYTLRAGFSRGSMRGTDFCNRGRYSLSVTCAQNKAGMAAKAALLARFFGPGGHRLDMTPQQEKAHILAAIEAGKARAQKKEDKALTYKDPATGWLYRVGPKPGKDGCFCIEYIDPVSSTVWKPWPAEAKTKATSSETIAEVLEARAKQNGWEPAVVSPAGAETPALDEPASDDLPEVCRSCRCATCSNEDCPTPCHQKNDEVEECEQLGPMGDDCEDYQPKEDAECLKTPAPNGAAAVTTETSVATTECPDISTLTNVKKSAAPASPADAEAATQSLSAADPASLAAESAPAAFDYSGLDAQTVADLHLAEREYAGGKKMAEMGLRRMADAVAIAHDALCVTIATKCRNGDGAFTASEKNFGRWCESVGLNRKAAERLLQVSKLMDNSTPREQKVLEELSPSLLYAAAKPSAPTEVVQAVKDGDITTHKQYQEAMAMIKERDAKIQELLEMSEAADRRADEAQAWAKKAESDAREAQKERDGARDALQAAKRRGDQWQEKAEARQARLQELENRPIQATAVDSDEVDRMVTQRLEEELAKQMPRQQEEQEQAARDAYDAFILTARSLDNLWRTLKPQIARLAPDQKNGAKNLLLQKLMEVKEELIHACEDHQP